MYKLLKFLGVAAVLVSSIGQASAFSSTVYPVTLTGSVETFLLSYSSTSAFSITGPSLELGNPGNYTFSFTTNATNFVSLSVSPVPLPASLPLFAMALFGLGLIGYHAARTNRPIAV